MTASALHPVVTPASRRRASGWFIVEGLLLILLGLVAAVLPVLAGVAAALVFGWVLVGSGLIGIVSLFAVRGHAHPAWSAVSALIALAAGAIVLWAPIAGVVSLALVVAAYLLLDAGALFALAFDQRRRAGRSWGWLVASAVVGVLLAGFIIVLRPAGEAALLGFIVAIDLFMGGIALTALGFGARRAG